MRHVRLPDLAGAVPSLRLPPALALPDGRLLLPFRRKAGGLTYDEANAVELVLSLLSGPPPVPSWVCMATGRMSAVGPTGPSWLARQAFDRAQVRL
jgi:hypothetical protein